MARLKKYRWVYYCLAVETLVLLMSFVFWRSSQGPARLKVHGVSTFRRLEPKHDKLPIFPDMPRVSMVFLTVDGTKVKRIWDDWYDVWLDYLAKLRQAGEDIGENRKNPYLTGVLFRNINARLKDSAVPTFVSDFIVPDPVKAGRWQLLNATRQAIRYALDVHPNATHYVLVSDTTVPVKPFHQIWGQLAVDPRSKLDLFCSSHREGYPKHSQWGVFRRDHALALVSDHLYWNVDKPNQLIRGTCPTLVSSSDEYWPLRIICENLNVTGTLVEDGIISANLEESESNFLRQFDTRSMAHPLGTVNWRTFVDWSLFNPQHSALALGERDHHASPNASHPVTYQSMTSRFLRTLVAYDHVWFARKIQDHLMVVQGCNLSPLVYLGDSLQGDLRMPYRPAQAAAKLPEDFGPSFDCALVDFLGLLLRHGPWTPIVGTEIPSSVAPYVSNTSDIIRVGEPYQNVYAVKNSGGELLEGGLDWVLAGTLKGSLHSGTQKPLEGVSVTLRPFHVHTVRTIEQARQDFEKA